MVMGIGVVHGSCTVGQTLCYTPAPAVLVPRDSLDANSCLIVKKILKAKSLHIGECRLNGMIWFSDPAHKSHVI